MGQFQSKILVTHVCMQRQYSSVSRCTIVGDNLWLGVAYKLRNFILTFDKYSIAVQFKRLYDNTCIIELALRERERGKRGTIVLMLMV